MAASPRCSSAEANKLTFDCGGACPDEQPCLVYRRSACDTVNSTASKCYPGTEEGCAYECFNWKLAITNPFSFHILHGKFKSDEEIKNEGTDSNWSAKIQYSNENTTVASTSNDKVTAIGRLNLPSYVTQLDIFGGSDPNAPRDYVVDVRLEPGLLQNQTQLSQVRLLNINIGSQVAAMDSLLPTSIQLLDISNNQLADLPLDLIKFPSLTQLYV
ncbi:TPA: hypothetical protein N0F65_012700 [Lagenidium giganteum]|uniref:Uncharacterized protein n=1 Tax=Lagenidium giganteum TaxID=4803 RepID=A0AAV2YE36_9STRA|nr:TPA: hypothetical protein N0F65_012700 [Lagenidium giganteum]